MDFTEKERSFLEELKSHEKMCIEKYKRHSEAAHDEQLKSLFQGLSAEEQQHLTSLEQISMGTVPPINAEEKPLPVFTAKYKAMLCPEKSSDMYLCTDVLSGEKQVSHLYDTATFEFRDKNVRDYLNHIQKDEQTHGKILYDYMTVNGMY